jgi:GT2 family glycosyltransferase
MTVFAIVACHDRRELTERCLDSARASARRAGVPLRFVVFDDGSRDGTAELLDGSPDVTRLVGDGSAYWAKGMATAERAALDLAEDRDVLLWLNDDVELADDAIGRLHAALAESPSAVWAAAVVDSAGHLSYSGLRRVGRHPLGFEPVEPQARSVAVDTFNGNVVFVEAGTARGLGGIDRDFAHSFADIDYGLRAARRGVPVLLAPGVFGTCDRNPDAPPAPVLAEWRAHLAVKGGGNFASLRRVIRRRHPVLWPVPILGSYLVWWARRVPRLLGLEGRR